MAMEVCLKRALGFANAGGRNSHGEGPLISCTAAKGSVIGSVARWFDGCHHGHMRLHMT